MKANKVLRVVTMVGGLDLVGELEHGDLTDVARIHRPFAIHTVPGQPGKLTFVDMTRTGVFSGDAIDLNMLCVMWSGPPGPQIEKAYAALRAGIVLPAAQDLSLNQ